MSDKKVLNSKEACLEMINAVIAKAEEHKKRIEESEDPNLAVIFIITDPEAEGGCSSCYANDDEMVTLLANGLKEYGHILMQAAMATL